MFAITFLVMALPAGVPAVTWLEPAAESPIAALYRHPVPAALSPTVKDAYSDGGLVQALSPSEISRESSPVMVFQSEDVDLINHIVATKELAEKIEGFADLPTSWAGTDTVIPSQETRSAAMGLLRNLSSDYPLPQVTPSADGEIGFVWYGRGSRVEALLGADIHLVWFGEFAGEIEAGDDVIWSGANPDGLLQMIERLQT
jgi:hypothetical protein